MDHNEKARRGSCRSRAPDVPGQDVRNLRSPISPVKPAARPDGVSLLRAPTAGEVEIAGRRYLIADRLAASLNVSVRTLARWNALGIGPPRIKIGRLVLFDLEKLPEWLATRETKPVRAPTSSTL
jgi:hypothetical protein